MTDDDIMTPEDARLEAILRSLTADDAVFDTPPTSVWEGIAAGAAKVDTTTKPVDQQSRARRSSQGRSRLMPVAAAAAVAVLAAGSYAAFGRDNGPSGRVLAAAPLSSAGLDGAPEGLSGRAEVIERSGKRYLRIVAKGMAPKSGEYLELWLIDTKVSGMVSLGVMEGTSEFALPDGLEFSDFPIVDVSTEPFDGKPTHSGASLVRGQLT